MSDATPTEAVARVRGMFEDLADDYDQSGVPFFQPIAARLCDLVSPQPGEQALDLGCGRGAAALRLAEAVTGSGSVTAVDISPAMVEHTRRAAAEAGLDQITTEVVDAQTPSLPDGSFDLFVCSLVLFFLPDPAGALAAWLRLLRPSGRFGISTFGAADRTFDAVGKLFRPFQPRETLDPLAVRASNPFESDEAMEQLVSQAGATDVRTVREPFRIELADAEAWRAWTMSTGQRAFWGRMTEEQRADVVTRATELLEGARDGAGRIVLHQDVRYTLGRI
jgi:ubiquinone/menaquinone biosynthesis C-methylase UbiE